MKYLVLFDNEYEPFWEFYNSIKEARIAAINTQNDYTAELYKVEKIPIRPGD